MVSDQEPRYRLVDDNGNIVGSLYGKADGSIAIQETDSGADREVALAPDGTFSAPSVETESVNTAEAGIDELVSDLDTGGNQLRHSDFADGERVQLNRYQTQSGGVRHRIKHTSGVSTEAETIYSGSDPNGSLVHVSGSGDGRFTDLVLYHRRGDATVIGGDADNVSGPDDRIYSVDGFDLQLEMSAGTYDIMVVVFETTSF